MVPPGGFSRGEQFERERVAPPLSRLLCLLSCRSKKGRPPAGSTSQFDHSIPLKKFMASIPASKYHPICKQSVFCPLAPSVTCGDSSLPEGAMGCVALHIGFQLIDSANCESLRHAFGVPAPFRKGAFGVQRKKGPVANALQQAQAIYSCYSSSGKVYCLRYFSKRSSNLALSVSSPAFRAVRYSWASSLPSDTWSISTAMLEQWSATRS